MKYMRANEVDDILRDLEDTHYEALPVIDCVFAQPTPKKNGRDLPARIRKISGINAYLASELQVTNFAKQAPSFFVLEVSYNYWGVLNGEQRKGLVDHYLMHFVLDADTGVWAVEPPEFGEFPAIIERHGFWRIGGEDRYREMVEAVSEQLSLLS